MEYQSFFMLLKSYKVQNGIFYSTNPLSAEGFVRIKKEQKNYSLVLQINNFNKKTDAYLYCNNKLKKFKIISSTTKLNLDYELDIDTTCVLLTDIQLFAVKNSTEVCQNAIEKLNDLKVTKPNMFEKIFGKVYDTYFFDLLKPKLASLFALGKKVDCLNVMYPTSKWTIVNTSCNSILLGIIYKDNFAYAIGVGDEQSQNVLKAKHEEYNVLNSLLNNDCNQNSNNSYISNNVVVNGKTYNLMFLSASNGKFINI